MLNPSCQFRKFILLCAIFCVAILAGAVYTLQLTHDKNYRSSSIIEDLKYLPSGTFLKGAALSFDEILADLLWIKTIGYFGEHAQTDQDFQWLAHILDVTTTLDPYFQDPYEFGGVVLANEVDDLDKSTELMKKGMANVPKHHKRYWYLPFFTAFNFMYHKNDYQAAADYLKIAASFPQSPSYLPLLVSRLYANTNDPGLAIPFLQEMINRASTPEVEKKLVKRIKEIQVKQHIQFLEKAVDIFKGQTGGYPGNLEELVLKNIINTLPEEPFGGRYFISKEDNSIQSSSDIDGLQLHIKEKKKSLPLILKHK